MTYKEHCKSNMIDGYDQKHGCGFCWTYWQSLFLSQKWDKWVGTFLWECRWRSGIEDICDTEHPLLTLEVYIETKLGLFFLLLMGKVLDNERRYHTCNDFSHWLKPYLALAKSINANKPMKSGWRIYFLLIPKFEVDML